MQTATHLDKQYGFEDDPFEAMSGWSHSRLPCPKQHHGRSPFSIHGSHSLLGVSIPDPASPSPGARWQQFRPDRFPPPPASVFADELRSLAVSGACGLSWKLTQRIKELAELEAGWDGEDAVAPKPEAMARTIGLVLFLRTALADFKEPFLVPTTGGFTQLEWRGGRRTVEYEATVVGWSIVGSETSARGERSYYEADAAKLEVDKLLAAYRWFAGLELPWPII